MSLKAHMTTERAPSLGTFTHTTLEDEI